LTLLSLFALLPRPLRPTLFPYTTLFRSTSCNAFKIDESIDSSGSKTRMRSSRLVVQAVDSFTGNRRAAAMSRCQRAASNHLCFSANEKYFLDNYKAATLLAHENKRRRKSPPYTSQR